MNSRLSLGHRPQLRIELRAMPIGLRFRYSPNRPVTSHDSQATDLSESAMQQPLVGVACDLLRFPSCHGYAKFAAAVPISAMIQTGS